MYINTYITCTYHQRDQKLANGILYPWLTAMAIVRAS